MNKIILNFELSDLGVILDDFLEDNGLCCYIMDGPMVQYPPSLELFIYNVYYIWVSLFGMHDMMNYHVLTKNQELLGNYICLIDMEIVTLLSLYEKLLDLQLIQKIPLNQNTIPKSSLNLLKQFDILIKLRMDIAFIHANLQYDFKMNFGDENILFNEYLSQWDLVRNSLKIFFEENVFWDKMPPNLKNELHRWLNKEYYDDKYYEKFINRRLFANHFDRYKYFRKIPHNIPYSPWSIVCPERLLENKAQWDLYLEKVSKNKII